MDQKIQNLINDKEFLKYVVNLETQEQVKNAFAHKGVVITDSDLESIRLIAVKSIEKGKALSEDDLDKISGGGKDKPPPVIVNVVQGQTQGQGQAQAQAPGAKATYPKDDNAAPLPAIAGLALGGAIACVGLALGGVSVYTKVKKKSWLAPI